MAVATSEASKAASTSVASGIAAGVRSWPVPDQLKYFAARFAYQNRNDLCPKSVEINRQRVQITWLQWWEARYGERLNDYIQAIRHQAQKASGDCGRQETLHEMPDVEAG